MDNSPDPGVVVVQESRSPSEAVIMAVAEAADVGPTDLPALHDVVDPDALDALFSQRAPGSVTFEYGGYTVTVREDAEVVVQESARLDSR